MLLRRLKEQVDLVGTEKTEHVLFVKMKKAQAHAYNAYLESDDVKRVLNGETRCFTVLNRLRRMCAHPYFTEKEMSDELIAKAVAKSGMSGKMCAVMSLLGGWWKQKRKASELMYLLILGYWLDCYKQRRYCGNLALSSTVFPVLAK